MTVPINFIKIYFVAIKNFINYILTEKNDFVIANIKLLNTTLCFLQNNGFDYLMFSI